jgi:hypothetical protein
LDTAQDRDETVLELVSFSDLACDGLFVAARGLDIDHRARPPLRLFGQAVLEIGSELLGETGEVLEQDFPIRQVLAHAIGIGNVAQGSTEYQTVEPGQNPCNSMGVT